MAGTERKIELAPGGNYHKVLLLRGLNILLINLIRNSNLCSPDYSIFPTFSRQNSFLAVIPCR